MPAKVSIKPRRLKIYHDSWILHHGIRIGRKGKAIIIRKFRTMKRNAHSAEQRQKALGGKLHKLDAMREGKFKDPRVTKVGSWLRKTHLDELPQLISWLKGDLIPVGIRPVIRSEYRQFTPEIKRMYDEMGPGLAGIQYACKKFPPTENELMQEYKRFYEMWKKSRTRAYTTYAWRIIRYRLGGVTATA